MHKCSPVSQPDFDRCRSAAELRRGPSHHHCLGGDGPLFHFSDTWQLVVNTGTTIITFLMVFLIQNSQNRDGAAMQAKLDELLRAVDKAREQFIGIEHLTDRQIELMRTALERNSKNHDPQAENRRRFGRSFAQTGRRSRSLKRVLRFFAWAR